MDMCKDSQPIMLTMAQQFPAWTRRLIRFRAQVDEDQQRGLLDPSVAARIEEYTGVNINKLREKPIPIIGPESGSNVYLFPNHN